MTEIVKIGTADEIATLPPGDRAVMVTHALIESKQWLAVATKGTDPTPIAEFKAWAATVAEMTRQKGLASEIQADALEMVRRAERGIGQAIRNGQEAGEIARAHEPIHVANQHGPAHLQKPEKSSVLDFVKHSSDLTSTYAMSDGVTDEQFEGAIADARKEGNLSRNNVVRKIKGQKSPLTREQRAEKIREWAASGHTRAQAAAKLGIGREAVTNIANDYGINFPADVLAKARRIDSARVTRETVEALEGLVIALPMVDFDQLDPREAQHWTASLDQSIRALNRFNKKMKEAVL